MGALMLGLNTMLLNKRKYTIVHGNRKDPLRSKGHLPSLRSYCAQKNKHTGLATEDAEMKLK